MPSVVHKILHSPRSLWIRGRHGWARHCIDRDHARLHRAGPVVETALNLDQWPEGLRHPTRFYEKCYRFFHYDLPVDLRDHRKYFTEDFRGFGEDAFHVMWMLLFREFQPRNFLEIGVYRGQTISLISLLAQRGGYDCEVFGISPFSSNGDSVSEYLTGIDYESDTLANFAHFNLPKPHLLCAYSTDPAAQALVASQKWDMIYIDGNHDFEVVSADWELCARHVRLGGIIVLDDAGLTTSYTPPRFATPGHPGPSKLAANISHDRFKEIMQVGHNRAYISIGT